MVWMANPWKHPKTGIYWLRRAVPEALRSRFGWELKKSLGTRDPAEARRLFAIEYTKAEQEFRKA